MKLFQDPNSHLVLLKARLRQVLDKHTGSRDRQKRALNKELLSLISEGIVTISDKDRAILIEDVLTEFGSLK